MTRGPHRARVRSAPVSLPEVWSTYVGDREAVCAAGPAGQERRMSRSELESSATVLCSRLRAAGVVRGDVVPVLCTPGPESVAGMLGVVRAGAAFAPIDAGLPEARLRTMLDQVAARVIVLGSDQTVPVHGVRPVPVDLVPAGTGTGAAPGDPRTADELAYVVFTSGSTGTPKAVGVSHGAFARHVRAAIELLDLDETSVALQFAGLGFDVVLEEIWPTLVAGGRVVARGSELWSLPELLALTVREGITTWQLPTAYWAALVHDFTGRRELVPPSTLSTVVIGSEAADTASARRWLDSPFAATRLINGYGPAEGVITATAWDSYRDPLGPGPHLPLGFPLRDREIQCVDPGGVPVPDGSRGEIRIAGACLAEGYLDDDEATRSRFVPLPDGRTAFRTGDLGHIDGDGMLHFHGRSDRQVQLDGVRVELGDVEAALLRCSGVHAAAADVEPRDSGGLRLVAHVVAHGGAGDRTIRRELGTLLPNPAIPASVRLHDRLPLTAHGKVDYAALRTHRQPHASRGGSDAS